MARDTRLETTSQPQLHNVRNASPVQQHASNTTIDMMGVVMSFGPKEEIYGENEPADYFYKVVSGAVETYRILNDGRRQIGGFYFPGDTFGLDVADDHAYSAEAIAPSKVLVIKRSAVMSRAAHDSEVAKELWTMTSRELQRVQDHVLLLIKSAEERVASFLIEMARRSADASEVQLPMSRQAIADYLGLTIETVSRTLTNLESKATIARSTSRRVVLRNRGALSRLNA